MLSHPERHDLLVATPASPCLRCLGRRVALLHDGPLGAGTHTLAFDGVYLPAGLYVARAASTGGVITRQFTLVR